MYCASTRTFQRCAIVMISGSTSNAMSSARGTACLGRSPSELLSCVHSVPDKRFCIAILHLWRFGCLTHQVNGCQDSTPSMSRHCSSPYGAFPQLSHPQATTGPRCYSFHVSSSATRPLPRQPSCLIDENRHLSGGFTARLRVLYELTPQPRIPSEELTSVTDDCGLT